MNAYTYRLEDQQLYNDSLYMKRGPKDAVTSIFRRLLRDCKDQDAVTCIIYVKNLATNKEYIYDCRAVYAPYQKLVSKRLGKVLTVYFNINILKLNKKCFTG